PCPRTIAYQETKTTSSTTGFQWEFGVEAGATIKKIFTIKSTFKYARSGSTTDATSTGTTNTYSFPVPPGKTCIPTRVSYRMSCDGATYTVNHDQWNTEKYAGRCAELGIDFTGKNRIFPGLYGRYHYYVDQGKLYEMISTSDFPPTNCDTVKNGDVWVRGMVLGKSEPDSKQPLFYTNGKSLSTISCVLKPL
ncbi:hypothetical protein BGW39_003247, partial [Mortierella sp. 14UC]